MAISMALSGTALAAAMGDELDSYTTEVRAETELGYGVYWTGSDYRRENYMEYAPNSSVFPVIVYGSKLLNNGNFVSMAKLLNEEGYYVVGGINGDFYNTWDNQPLGLVVKDGRIISSDGGHYAIGFRQDGSAIIGKPELSIKASFSGETYFLNNINKSRAADFNLYTSDYATTTRNTTSGLNVILSAAEGAEITMSCELELTVEEIIEGEKSVTIPEGKYVLSLPDTSDDWRKNGVHALEVGDTVKLSVSSNEGWEDVESAIGTIYQIVSDGAVSSSVPVGTEPRTAVGVKADGSVVFYTVDGRKSGHSVGATTKQVAERMIELGCVSALMMDGGGSTTLNAVRPGESAISQINTPSDGAQRSVTNYIMLVSTEPPSGDADRLVIYPRSTHLLLGGSFTPSVKAVDTTGFAIETPSELSFKASDGLGSFEGAVFTAEKSGKGTITASAGDGVSGDAQINIVATPDTISVKNEKNGAKVTNLNLKTGESFDLTATASHNHLALVSDDLCYEWKVLGDIGTIDEKGSFVAAETSGEGSIEVTAGENTVSIPVTVKYPAGIYSDVSEDDWYYNAVKSMGERGYMGGVTETEFAPNIEMTRGMLVTLLYRIEGAPAVSGSLSFEDVEANQWYSNAVLWASSVELVNGYDEKTFGVNDSISREQMATLLMRYDRMKNDAAELTEDLSGFSDVAEISPYAVDAVKWAVQNGLIKGMTETEFAPKGTATRGQVAVLLDRYLSA